MRNKKAQGSALVWKVIMIIGVLVIAVVMIGFMIQFSILAPARMSAESCRWSLDIKSGWNEEVQDAIDDAQDEEPWWYPGKWTSQLLTWDGEHGWMGQMIGDTGNMFKLRTDTCVENTQTICEGPADYVAKCIYRRAAETYYALRGGKEGTKRDFNLYEIIVRIKGDGILEFKSSSSCSNYISDASSKTGTSGNLNWKFDSPTSTCNITFDVVDERVMTLAMIEECRNSEEGPGNILDCKCFVNVNEGYNLYNGLPNTVYSGDISTSGIKSGLGTTATYPEYSDYRGCGYKQPNPPTKDKMAGSDWSWDDTNLIVWDPSDLSIEFDEDEKLYTRIENRKEGGKNEKERVVVSNSKD